MILLPVFIAGFSHLSYSSDKSCKSVFSAREEISDKVLRSDMSSYKGQEGYMSFVTELTQTKSMDYVFKIVSQTLDKKQMKELGWQKLYGTVSKFKELQGRKGQERTAQIFR